MRAFTFPAVLLLTLATGASAAAPQPAPMPPEIAAPRDAAYPGTIKLDVDARDVERHIYRVRQTIPVAPGPVTLLYPQWLPGNHAPTGRVDKLAGLVIKSNGQALPWTRDPVQVYAYHVNAPQGASTLDVEFQFLSPGMGDEGRVVMTPEMLNLQWNQVVLYPAGHYASQITIEPSVQLPEGWQFASALEIASGGGDAATFKPVSLEMLVDSPMFAGRYFERVMLDEKNAKPVALNIVADSAEMLKYKPEHIEFHRELVRQADRLFGPRHYNHYDFLLALTARMGGIGLEHHQSSENGTVTNYFTEWDKSVDARSLLPHEYVHSWNGKFRRPADLWTPNYNVPMRDSLLWVYEGQTQYWGHVLSARSGIWTKDNALEALAMTAATYELQRVGRLWRPLQDTVNDPIIAMRRPAPYRGWQRSEDYYSEGLLVWLDADTLIRELSKGRRSLDDFARNFFGIDDGGSITAVTYTFEDVVAALNAVQPHDWAAFLRDRLDKVGAGAPLDGLERGGYRLAFTETPTEYFKNAESRRRITDLTYSLGLVLNRDARIVDVVWNSPAFDAELTVGTQIMAVNNLAYDADRLKKAVTAAKDGGALEMIVKNGDHFRTVKLLYRDGLRYPRLERDSATPARLDQIFAQKK